MYSVILIGCGGFGKLWWDILRKNASVVALVDVNENYLEEARDFFSLEKDQCYLPEAEWEFINADIMIDCSPYKFHYENIKRAINQGMNILSSKPLSASACQAKELINLAHKKKVQCFVIQQKRYYPVFCRLKELIAEGEIGKIENIKVELYLSGLGWEPGFDWRAKIDQPTLYEAAIHHFDIFHAVLQDTIVDIFGFSWNPEWSPFKGNSSLSAIIKTQKGTVIRYDATFAQRNNSKLILFDSGWEIEGTKAIIQIDKGQIYINGEQKEVISPSPDLDVLNEVLWNEFIESIDELKPHELTFSENSKSLMALFACEESIRQKKWVNLKQFEECTE